LRFYPILGVRKRSIPCDDWWKAHILIQKLASIDFTRADGILDLADTDGGAHVDAKLNADYHGLTRGNALRLEVWRHDKDGVIENNLVYPIARQCAHEVLGTMREQLPQLGGVCGPRKV
jgi:hypothetical protein